MVVLRKLCLDNLKIIYEYTKEEYEKVNSYELPEVPEYFQDLPREGLFRIIKMPKVTDYSKYSKKTVGDEPHQNVQRVLYFGSIFLTKEIVLWYKYFNNPKTRIPSRMWCFEPVHWSKMISKEVKEFTRPIEDDSKKSLDRIRPNHVYSWFIQPHQALTQISQIDWDQCVDNHYDQLIIHHVKSDVIDNFSCGNILGRLEHKSPHAIYKTLVHKRFLVDMKYVGYFSPCLDLNTSWLVELVIVETYCVLE